MSSLSFTLFSLPPLFVDDQDAPDDDNITIEENLSRAMSDIHSKHTDVSGKKGSYHYKKNKTDRKRKGRRNMESRGEKGIIT